MADARTFRARQCTSADCELRFPVDDGSPLGAECPLCRAPTQFVDEAYETEAAVCRPQPRATVHVLLDNIRSLRNVGSVFRSADGAGVDHIHLCGITPTPAHPKLAKTALGAEKSVAWTRYPDATAAAETLAESGARLWAIEGGAAATSLFEAANLDAREGSPIVLVFGHEVSGVDPRVSRLCERVVCLPMMGTKTSLNVSVAMGVAAYVLRFAR